MALIDNIGELKKHNSALFSGTDLVNFQSFVDDAINGPLSNAFGYDFIMELSGKKTSGSSKEKRLIHLLQKAVTGFAIASYADNGAVTISNTGVAVIKSNSSLPASDKKIVQLKKVNLSSAYAAIEMAIQYLEENLNEFDAYKNSEYRLNNRNSLINSTLEFQAAGVQLNDDSHLFHSLKPYIESALEKNGLSSLLGDLIDTLITGIRANSLDDKHRRLLKLVRRPLAALTMVEAIPYRAVSIGINGVFEMSSSVGGFAANTETSFAASDKKLTAVMAAYSINAESDLIKLEKYLNDNSSDFGFTRGKSQNINDGSASNVYFF